MNRPLFALVIVIILIISSFFISRSCPGRQDAKLASGTVTAIYPTGTKDAVFKISGSKWLFSIKKALVKNFKLSELRNKLLGKKVNILYADQWTPLDPSASKVIAELSCENDLLYSEIQK